MTSAAPRRARRLGLTYFSLNGGIHRYDVCRQNVKLVMHAYATIRARHCVNASTVYSSLALELGCHAFSKKKKLGSLDAMTTEKKG
jgi:glycine/D-amino acid oxidase-like deaminating enzyme